MRDETPTRPLVPTSSPTRPDEVAIERHDELGALMAVANREHAACEGALHGAFQHALRCGGALLELRALAPKGEISSLIEASFSGTRQNAYHYMRLATYKHELRDVDSIHAALQQVRGLPPIREEAPEIQARRRRSTQVRAKLRAGAVALARQERSNAALRHGGNVAQAFSLIRKCAQVLDPAEREFSSRDAKRHARSAYEYLRKAEDELALALGVE